MNVIPKERQTSVVLHARERGMRCGVNRFELRLERGELQMEHEPNVQPSRTVRWLMLARAGEERVDRLTDASRVAPLSAAREQHDSEATRRKNPNQATTNANHSEPPFRRESDRRSRRRVGRHSCNGRAIGGETNVVVAAHAAVVSLRKSREIDARYRTLAPEPGRLTMDPRSRKSRLPPATGMSRSEPVNAGAGRSPPSRRSGAC